MDPNENQIVLSEESFGILELSIIDEIDENSVIGSTISEENRHSFMENSSDKTDEILSQTDPLAVSEEINFENFTSISSSASQLPTTPPEVLRKQISNLEDQNEYLSNELEELIEFTKLERQVNHNDCIPKDQVKAQEDEIALVNEKVQHLIKENSNLKNNLEQKDADLKQLEEKFRKSLCFQEAAGKNILIFGKKLRANLQDVEEEAINNNPQLEYILRNCDFEKTELDIFSLSESIDSNLSSFDAIHDLLDTFISNANKLKTRVLNSDLNHKDLSEENKKLALKIEHLENCLSLSRDENNHLEENLTDQVKMCNEFCNALNTSEKELKEIKHLLEVAAEEKMKLQDNLENISALFEKDCVEEELLSFFSELERHLDSWSENKSVKDFLAKLQEDGKLHSLSNLFISSKTNPMFLQLLYKFKNLLTYYDDENFKLRSTVEELKMNVRDAMNETDKLMRKFEKCDQNKIDDFAKKLNAVENELNTTQSEKTYFEKKLSIVEMKMKEQSKVLSVLEGKLKDYVESLEKTREEKLKLQTEIENLKDLKRNNELQESFVIILNELETFTNSWENSRSLKDLCEIILEDKLNLVLNSIMDSNVKSTFFQVLRKLRAIFICHEEEYAKLQTTIESLKSLINKSESNTSTIKMEVKALDHHINSTLINRVNQLEIKYRTHGVENLQLQDDLLKMETEYKNLKMTLSVTETKLEDTERLLEITNSEKLEMRKEVENFKKILRGNSLQEIFELYSQQLDILLADWNHDNNLRDLFEIFEKNTKPCHCLNSIVDSQVQTTFFKVLEKLKTVLGMFEENYNDLEKRSEQLRRSIICLEENISLLKTTNKNLEQENDLLNEKLQENRSTKQNYISDCSEELKTIRELMAREVLSLDFEENKEELMSYSSVEIFSKLMQNIIKKEGEISSDLQKGYKRELQKTLEDLKNKLKTQSSWISELESDNDKLNKQLTELKETNQELEGKNKTLLIDLKLSSSETLRMKSKILQLETENDTLYSKVSVLEKLSNTEKSKIVELEEELLMKTNTINTLENKFSLNILEEEKSSRNNEDTLYLNNESTNNNSKSKSNVLPARSPSETIYDVTRTRNTSPRSNNSNGGCCDIKSSHFDDDKCNESKMCLLHELKSEKALIKDILINKMSNEEELGDQVFTFSDNLFVLKDLVQIIGKKIIEMEGIHSSKVQELKSSIENKNKELNDLKLSINEFYSDFVSDNRKLKSDTINSMNKTIFDCGDAISLKRELELVSNECTTVVNWSREIEQSAKIGHCMIQNLRDEFLSIKEEIHKKSLLNEDLIKTVQSNENKVAIQKVEIEILNKEKDSVIMKNKLLKDELNNLKVQLLDIECALTKVEMDFPHETEDISGKINHLNEVFKRNIEKNINLTEDLNFFILKFHYIHCYSRNIENQLVSAQEEKKVFLNELNILKAQLNNTRDQLAEANLLVNQIILKLPQKVSSVDEALEILDQVLHENVTLKGSQEDSLQERKITPEKLSSQLKEVESLTHVNSSLKLQLEKYEDYIRNLRSELRSVRSQNRRKENDCLGNSALSNKQQTEAGIQTDTLCCEQLKASLDIKNHQITSLELQVEGRNYPYKKKVSDLELALSQAKQRIRELRCELGDLKSCNKDLIESSRSERHYQEESEEQ